MAFAYYSRALARSKAYDRMYRGYRVEDHPKHRREIEQDMSFALADFNRALELAPSYTPALISRGIHQMIMRRYDDALKDFGILLREDPNNPVSLYLRGITKMRSGRGAEGDRDLAAARAINPEIDSYVSRQWGIAP